MRDFLVTLSGDESDMVSHSDDVSRFSFVNNHGFFECKADSHADAIRKVTRAVWDFSGNGTLYAMERDGLIYAFVCDEEGEYVLDIPMSIVANEAFFG